MFLQKILHVDGVYTRKKSLLCVIILGNSMSNYRDVVLEKERFIHNLNCHPVILNYHFENYASKGKIHDPLK